MTDSAVQILLAIIGFLLTVMVVLAGAAFKIYLRNTGLKETVSTKNSERIEKIEAQLLLIDFQVKPMWAKAQKQLSDELHHPHAKDQETDKLIDKLERLHINEAETERLKQLFHERATSTDPAITEREKSIAKIMPVIMDLTLEEAKAKGNLTDVELVGVENKDASST
jgi:hypothetical protein